MTDTGKKGRLYITRHIWLPQEPMEKFNHFMGNWINRHMPPLPLQGAPALEQFPQLGRLQENHAAIRSELDAILQMGRRVPDLETIHPRDASISSPEWRNYVMRLFGHDIEPNAGRCPETIKAVEAIPGVHTFLFSILEPHSRIPPHYGWAAGVVRVHYPLIIPDEAGDCFIEISGERYSWAETEPLLFDDTRYHQVENNTDQMRVVLIIDFEPPLPFGPRAYCGARYYFVRRSEEITHMLETASVNSEAAAPAKSAETARTGGTSEPEEPRLTA